MLSDKLQFVEARLRGLKCPNFSRQTKVCRTIMRIMTDLAGNTFFEGPAGLIEAILKEPDGPVTRAAIVCHPHPLFGGTMHNKVVYRIAKTFQMSGFVVLRF